MTDREKLIEILEQKRVDVLSPCPKKANCSECEYGNIENCRIYELADYLISNGVSVQNNSDHSVDVNKMAQNKWISVEDKLPSKKGKYLCLWNYNSEDVEPAADVLYFDGKCFPWEHKRKDVRVSHWRQLPELP